MGGFTQGFKPNVYDFAGMRLKKKELALKERALDARIGKEEPGMKSSPTPVSKIDPKYADKFKPGTEELMKKLNQFAFDNADALNPKNTDTDELRGVYDPAKMSIYRNMEMEIMNFAAHGKAYVTAYKAYDDKVKKKDEYLNNAYNIDLIPQDAVYLTESMVKDNMGDSETASDYSWLWNGGGTAFDDGMGQQTPMMKDGEYVYEQGADGQRYLLGEDGQKLISYSKDANGVIDKSKSGIYTYERIYNQDYTDGLLDFNGKGNIVYGEEGNKQSYIDVWSKDFLKLDEHKYSTNGFWEIGKGLTDFDLIRDEVGGGRNQYMTNESVNSMWAQAEAVSEFNNSTNQWNNESSLIAAKMTAEEIAIKLGNTNPTKEYLQDIVNKIMLGNERNNEGELINPGAQLPDSLKGVYEHGSDLKIDTYSDFMTSKIIDTWKARHASVDIRPKSENLQGVVQGPYALDYNNADSRNTEIKYKDSTGNNTASGIHILNKPIKNVPVPWQGVKFDGDGNAVINSASDVGFMSFNNNLTSILQKGGSTGSLTSGQNSHRVVDKRTGQLMDGATWDKANQQYVFNSQEDAENGLIVAGLEGFWKPDDANKIRELYETNDDDLIIQADRMTIDQILESEKGIEGFFPLNQSTLSVDQLKYYQGVIDKSKTIKKVIKKGDEFVEFAMNDDGEIIDEPFVMPGSQVG